MSQVRSFSAEDVAPVAAMFQRTFVDGSRSAPPALARALEDTFLRHPWRDPEIGSLVHVANDTVTGFIGVLPVKLNAAGRHVRAAVAGSLMVEAPESDPLAGARLLRAFLKGPQELSFSETANPLSHRMWLKAGGRTVDGLSLDWVRVFRPAATAVAFARSKTGAAALLRPFAGLGDLVARRLAGDMLRAAPAPDGITGAEVSREEMAADLLELAGASRLHPEWDAASLRWFLSEAEVKAKRGTFHRRAVRGKRGDLIGCVLYHARPGDLGFVLHLAARTGREDDVLDELFAHGERQGLAGFVGRVVPAFREPLARRHTLLFRRAASVAHSRDAQLLAALEEPGSVITGLAAESWTPLIGGRFQ